MCPRQRDSQYFESDNERLSDEAPDGAHCTNAHCTNDAAATIEGPMRTAGAQSPYFRWSVQTVEGIESSEGDSTEVARCEEQGKARYNTL